MAILVCPNCGLSNAMPNAAAGVCPRCGSPYQPMPQATSGPGPSRNHWGGALLWMIATIVIGLAVFPFLACGGWIFLAQRARAQTAAKIAEFDNQLFPPYEFSSLYTIRYPRVLNDVDIKGRYLKQINNDGSHIMSCQFTPYGDDTSMPVLCITVLTWPNDGELIGPERELVTGGLHALKKELRIGNVVASPETTWNSQGFTFERTDFTADHISGQVHGFLLVAPDLRRVLHIYVLCNEPPDSETYRLLEVSAATIARNKL